MDIILMDEDEKKELGRKVEVWALPPAPYHVNGVLYIAAREDKDGNYIFRRQRTNPPPA